LPLLTAVCLEHHQLDAVFFRIGDDRAYQLACHRLEEGEVGDAFSAAELSGSS